MKWIGQHIWDFISRFRSTVYIENLETSSEENVLVVDSDGKVTKNTTLGGADLTYNGSTANGILTYGSASVIDVESTFTYQGTSSGSHLLQSPVISVSNSMFNAYVLDVNAAYAGSHTVQGFNIDYDKSTVTTGSGEVNIKGLTVDLNDTTTNDVGTTHNYFGIKNILTHANAQGTITHYGLQNILSGGDVQYAIKNSCAGATAATTYGLHQTIIDGGYDLYFRSSADTNDYFSLKTGANGETTLTTVDGGATAGHLNLVADGNITMSYPSERLVNLINSGSSPGISHSFTSETGAESHLYMYPGGDTSTDYFHISVAADGETAISTVDNGPGHAANLTFSIDGFTKFDSTDANGGGVEIENGSASGNAALLIDNDDTDQVALDIDAANITQDIVQIDGRTLTTHYAINTPLADITNTGGGMKISWGDDQTTDMNRTGGGSAMIHLDYDMYGMNFNLAHANGNGTMNSYGIKGVVTGGDYNVGLELQCQDDKGEDIRLLSSANSSDYFSIATRDDGETTLTTFENGGGSTAHMNLVADGNINLDAVGVMEINADGGTITFLDDTAVLAKISSTGLSFLDNTGAGIVFEGTTDDSYNTTLTAADTTSSSKTITLPDATGTVALQNKHLQVVSSNFFDDIGTTKHYIPISSQSTSEQTSDGNTITDFLAPCSLKVKEVMVKLPGTTSGSGDLTVGIETSNMGASVFSKSIIETETVSVTSSNDNDIVHFMFDDTTHATIGQNLSITIQSSADLSGSQNWYVTTIFEFDFTTRHTSGSAVQTS